MTEVTNVAESLQNLSKSLSGALNNPNLPKDTQQLFRNTVGALNQAVSAVKDLKQ